MESNDITEAMKSEDFVNSILDMQTPEEVQEAFREKGVEISLDEVKLIGAIINKMVEKNSVELSDEDLSEISGGNNQDVNLRNDLNEIFEDTTKSFESKVPWSK